MNTEFEQSNGKRIAMIIFFLNAPIMLITGGVIVFNKDLFIWIRVVDVCNIIFWYINIPVMGFFVLIIVYFTIRLLIIVVIKLLCLIPAVDRKIDKDNLSLF